MDTDKNEKEVDSTPKEVTPNSPLLAKTRLALEQKGAASKPKPVDYQEAQSQKELVERVVQEQKRRKK
jgi:glutathione S-transferase